MRRARFLISILGLLAIAHLTVRPTQGFARGNLANCDTGVVTLNYCNPNNEAYMDEFSTEDECPGDEGNATMRQWCNWLQEEKGATNCDIYTDVELSDAGCDADECYDPSTPTVRAYYLECEYGGVTL